MIEVLQNTIFGISTGSYLLLGSIGFTLIARVEGFLNIAHASLILLGAYTTWYLNAKVGWPVIAAGAAAVAVTALVALLTHLFIYRPIHPFGPAVVLISSVGVTFGLQGIIEMIVGSGTHLYDISLPELIRVGQIRINPFHIVVVSAAFVSLGLLQLLLTRTRIGRHIRAVSINPELAQNRGISLDATSKIVWLIAGAVAGLAGVMLGLLGTLTTDIALRQLLFLAAVSILAGFRSLPALALAAILTGLAMDLSVLWIPTTYRTTIPFVVIIIGLILRPGGLLKGERA